MADISILSRLVNGIQRNVDLSANTLVLSSLKLGTSELTKAKLDLLVLTTDSPSAVDASAQHHHDGRYYTETELDAGQLDNRYFTETELGSVADGASGASLIGVDQTPAFTNISGASVQAILESIDTALGTAGGNEFGDDVFRIFDNVDNTKKIAFQASGITTATVRTITMPDTDVDLGQIATNTSNISTNASNITSNDTDIADLVSLSGVAANSTSLGTFTGTTIPDSQTIKQALQALETYAEASRSLINSFEWANSAKDYIVNNTAVPPTEVSGDRYILSHDGGAPNAAWDGASAGDLVEFNGTIWVATTPTLGVFVSVDDESSVLYYWGGAAWSTKAFEATTASLGLTKVGFDIRLADAAAANGIAVSSGAISVQLSATPGLEFAANLLQVKVDATGGANLASVVDRNSNGMAIRVDDSTIEDNGGGAAGQLRIKDLGVSTAKLAATSVTAAKLGSDVAGDGLSGGNGSAIAFSATAAAGTGLENDGSNNLRVASGAFDGSTITGGGGSAAAVQHAPAVQNAEVAGEAFPVSGVRAVRYGIPTLTTPETSGRVYLADPTELSLVKAGGNQDPFHVVGLCIAASQVAADPVNVVKKGLITATSHGLIVGQPCWLDSAGVLTSTVPSAAGEAVVKVGVPKDANTIDINIQIMGVNG